MPRRAFTLVELVMVTAIIAVIAAIAVPRYGRSVANMRALMAARKLSADLGMVRAQARAASASRSIEFAGAGYRVVGMQGIDGAANYRVSLADDPYRASFTVTYDGVGAANTVTFDGYGTPDRGISVQIVAGGSSRTVTLSRTTGATSITTP